MMNDLDLEVCISILEAHKATLEGLLTFMEEYRTNTTNFLRRLDKLLRRTKKLSGSSYSSEDIEELNFLIDGMTEVMRNTIINIGENIINYAKQTLEAPNE
jgi:hypothetical protein